MLSSTKNTTEKIKQKMLQVYNVKSHTLATAGPYGHQLGVLLSNPPRWDASLSQG